MQVSEGFAVESEFGFEAEDLRLYCAAVWVSAFVGFATDWNSARKCITDGKSSEYIKMPETGIQETQARGSSVGWSFRDVSEVLPEFDPVKDNIDISQWIDKELSLSTKQYEFAFRSAKLQTQTKPKYCRIFLREVVKM